MYYHDKAKLRACEYRKSVEDSFTFSKAPYTYIRVKFNKRPDISADMVGYLLTDCWNGASFGPLLYLIEKGNYTFPSLTACII